MSVDRLELFAHLHHNIGAIHAAEQRYGAAIRCFEEAQYWLVPSARNSIRDTAGAAFRAASEAYQAGDRATALARWREAHAGAPEDASVRTLGRGIATHFFNAGASAFNEGRLGEAVDWLAASLELDPDLVQAREPLANALRQLTGGGLARGSILPALAYLERWLDLEGAGPADRELKAGLRSWLRQGLQEQVRASQVGGAVRLLQILARIDPTAPGSEVALIEPIGALARMLGEEAPTRPVPVLEAAIVLHPICPSAQLSWAGAVAYEAAIVEARRLHTAGEVLEAVELCEPATRYRPGGPHRQLPHVLGTMLCRRTTDLLESDRPAALALHARTLRFLKGCRSPGVVRG